MKLYSPEFERRLRRKLRPIWKADRRQRGAATRSSWHRHRSFPAWLIYLLCSLPVLLILNLQDRARVPEITVQALSGLVITGFLLVMKLRARKPIQEPPELGFLLWMPTSDELIAQWSWHSLSRTRVNAWVVLTTLLVGFHLGSGRALTWEMLPHTLLLPVLGGWAAAGLAATPLPRGAVAALLLLIIAVGVCLLWQLPGYATLLKFFHDYGAGLQWLHPGGWLVALWQATQPPWHWRLEWLLVLPLVLLAESTRFWYQRHLARLNTGAILDLVRWTPFEAAHDEIKKQEEGPSGETIREAWRANSGALVPQGRFQTWLYSRLSRRERMLCGIVESRTPTLFALWLKCLKFCAFGWLAALIVRQTGAGGTIFGYAMAGGALYLLAQLAFYGPVPAPAFLATWFPVGYGEMRRLQWKLAWPVLLLMSPMAVLYATAFGWMEGATITTGALGGVKVVLATILVHPALVTLQYSSGSGDTRGWRWTNLRIFANILLILGGLTVAFASLFFSEWISWLYLVLGSLPAIRLYAVHRRYWDRRRFDIGVLGQT